MMIKTTTFARAVKNMYKDLDNKENKIKIYLGCDLFVEGMRNQAIEVENLLNEKCPNVFDIYNPANNLEINDKESFASGHDILMADYNKLKECDVLIALLDTMDSGLCAEMGMSWILGIPIYQLHTDIRLLGVQNKLKHEEMEKDIFQNDFMYIIKLVTGLSYVDNTGYKYDEPTVFRDKEKLVDTLIKNFGL